MERCDKWFVLWVTLYTNTHRPELDESELVDGRKMILGFKYSEKVERLEGLEDFINAQCNLCTHAHEICDYNQEGQGV